MENHEIKTNNANLILGVAFGYLFLASALMLTLTSTLV